METSKYPWPGGKPVAIKLNHEFYSMLKHEVEDVCDKKVLTADDCFALANDVYSKTLVRVDVGLLKKLFLQPTDGQDLPPSDVNTLSLYCGYNSTAELIFSKRMHDNVPVSIDNYLLKYFLRFFNSVPEQYGQHEAFCSFASGVIRHLNVHADQADVFHKGIVKSAYGMRCYFEQFINIDKLQSFYGDGLYLYVEASPATEQKVFGYALLCIRYWLSGERELLDENFKRMQVLGFDEENPIFCGAYMSAKLLYNKSGNGDVTQIFEEANNLHELFRGSKMRLNERFELLFCRVCLMAGCFEESLYYTQYLLKLYFNDENRLEETDFYHTLLVLKVVALTQIGKIGEAGRLFEDIKPEQFNFLSRKTDTVLYQGLEKYFAGKNN